MCFEFFHSPTRKAEQPIGLDWQKKTTTLHVHHTFLNISLPSLHDYDVKMLYSTLVKNVNKRQRLSFYFPELWSSLLEFYSRKIGRVGISTITLEVARIHFFSDVFIAVAVVIWELKQQRQRRLQKPHLKSEVALLQTLPRLF